MGMYTELFLQVELRKDTPEDVLDVLRFMLGELDNIEEEIIPKDPLFETDRWRYMLRCCSFYHFPRPFSKLFKELDNWFLFVRSDLKNYDGEIEHFLSWLAPYIDAYNGDLLGWHIYEEESYPHLIYMGSKPTNEYFGSEPQYTIL